MAPTHPTRLLMALHQNGCRTVPSYDKSLKLYLISLNARQRPLCPMFEPISSERVTEFLCHQVASSTDAVLEIRPKSKPICLKVWQW